MTERIAIYPMKTSLEKNKTDATKLSSTSNLHDEATPAAPAVAVEPELDVLKVAAAEGVVVVAAVVVAFIAPVVAAEDLVGAAANA